MIVAYGVGEIVDGDVDIWIVSRSSIGRNPVVICNCIAYRDIVITIESITFRLQQN